MSNEMPSNENDDDDNGKPGPERREDQVDNFEFGAFFIVKRAMTEILVRRLSFGGLWW
jgi:hypothetical protein